METPTHCTLCPRRCGADRTRTHGLCGGGGMVKIARAALHFLEEFRISGTHRQRRWCSFGLLLAAMLLLPESRTSAGNFWREISTRAPADIFRSFRSKAHTTSTFITAGHYSPGMRGTDMPARAVYPGGIQYRRL